MRHGFWRESWKYIISIDFHRFPSISIDFHRFLSISIDFHRFPSIDSAKPDFRVPSTPCSTCAPFCYHTCIFIIKIKNPSFISLLPLPHISFRMPLHTPMLFYVLFLYFDYTSCLNPVTPSSSPTLFNYLTTMHNIITHNHNIVPQLQQAALSEILKLQQAAL
jgi:hypothetical protein